MSWYTAYGMQYEGKPIGIDREDLEKTSRELDESPGWSVKSWDVHSESVEEEDASSGDEGCYPSMCGGPNHK